MRKSRYLLLFSLTMSSTFLLISQAFAEVKQTETVTHYTVILKPEMSLKTALKNSTSIRKNNRHWFGETQWVINPLYRFRKLSGSCYVSQRSVELSIVMTLPQLQPAAHITEAQTAQFNAFYQALLEHEKGHKRLGIEAAKEVDEYLALPTISENCQTLQVRVNEEISTIINKYKQLNQQYDKQTQHGKTQGAVVTGPAL